MSPEEREQWFRIHTYRNALAIDLDAESVFPVLSADEVDNGERVQKLFDLKGFFVLDEDGRIIAYRWLVTEASQREAAKWEEMEVEGGDRLKALSAEKRKELDPVLEGIVEGVERRQTSDEGRIEGPVLKIVRLGKSDTAHTKVFLTDADGGIYVLDQNDELHLLPAEAELHEGAERFGWEAEGNLYYWDWEEREERLIEKPAGMLDLEGFEERWSPEQQRWEYVDESGQVVAFWGIDPETGVGRIELVEGVTKLVSEWQGLYYRADLDELDSLFQRQMDEYGKAFLLPVDPTMPGIEITFEIRTVLEKKTRERIGLSCALWINAPNQLLIRAPIAGKAVIVQSGSKLYHAELEKAGIELPDPALGLQARSTNHAFFDDSYEFLPAVSSHIEPGTPWVRIPIGEDNLAVAEVFWSFDLWTYEWTSPEVIALMELLCPQNLLRTEDGRIVYVAQE